VTGANEGIGLPIVEAIPPEDAPQPAERSPVVIRLLPPRPTFPQDISEDEQRIMGDHVVY
jgi:hypothetical protein